MMIYDERMDKECLILCDALNAIPGIKTFESCCGHGETMYHIWFTAKNVKALCSPTMGCSQNYCGHFGWHIEVDHVESPNKAIFLLEGPIGEEAYAAAGDIAKTIAGFQTI
jgi:hypothetical protein